MVYSDSDKLKSYPIARGDLLFLSSGFLYLVVVMITVTVAAVFQFDTREA